ncbi:RtcB family protein, partial [bacterium]|nr:RtcB family protein [bacterium]
ANVPSGVGRGGKIGRVSEPDFQDVLTNGAEWAVRKGYGWEEDLKNTEESGRLEPADPSKVSDKAFKRGSPQLGSLGAGNNFLEIQQVEKIYNEEAAKTFGIDQEGQVTVMIHTGSRGCGHQIASDYLREMERSLGQEKINSLPDRELIYANFQSKLGQDYFKAMCAAANFAFCNRQMITHWTREAFSRALGKSTDNMGLELVYDVCHNIAKVEKHKINGSSKDVVVHRKGATRAFPPGHEDIPEKYKKVGQPVLIPGSMGTASYVLVGTEKAMDISFGSTAHGAGRTLSRSQAIRSFRGEKIQDDLKKKGISLKAQSWKVIAEEAPQAYKDIDEVVKVSNEEGIGNLVVKL